MTTNEFMEKYVDALAEEVLELVEALELLALKLENTTTYDAAVIDECFRHVHTIKGNAGLYGIAKMQKVADRLETLFSNIKEKQESLPDDWIDFFLAGVDLLKQMGHNIRNVEQVSAQEFFKAYRRLDMDRGRQIT